MIFRVKGVKDFCKKNWQKKCLRSDVDTRMECNRFYFETLLKDISFGDRNEKSGFHSSNFIPDKHVGVRKKGAN